MAPLSFLFFALALASMYSVLGAPSREPLMPTSTPSVAPSSSLPRDGLSIVSTAPVSETDIGTYLDAHNEIRRQHGANPLTWSTELSLVAQAWANECNFNYTNSQYGQNVGIGSGPFGIKDAITMWANECNSYDPNNPLLPVAWQFTQIVWKATTELGCARVFCPGGSLPIPGNDPTIYVCEYSPGGNVDGEFAQNVQVVSGSGFGIAAGGPG